MELAEPTTSTELFAAQEHLPTLIAHPNDSSDIRLELAKQANSAGMRIVVGPEGGFSDNEIELSNGERSKNRVARAANSADRNRCRGVGQCIDLRLSSMKGPVLHVALLGVLLTICMASPVARGESRSTTLDEVVLRAFVAVHDGWSTDEVLLQDELNQQFIAHCRRELPDSLMADLNWKLLNLRKAGKLKVEVTKRRRDDHESYRHLAEIAARTVQDKHRMTTDQIMCDAATRREFDEQARLLAQVTNPYAMRKAAFGLRKSRRLRPELVLRIADWSRDVTVHQATELAKDISAVPATPGIYIFRDSTGYLYVGESVNLRMRLSQHLDDSDRKSLAHYLRTSDIEDTSIEIHAFPNNSRAKKVSVRRAYESALIASRKPRFNLRP